MKLHPQVLGLLELAEGFPKLSEGSVDTARSREMGGTGLGLSIVKHVAQVHGGSIEVSSTPGTGSSFRLRIPAAAIAAAGA